MNIPAAELRSKLLFARRDTLDLIEEEFKKRDAAYIFKRGVRRNKLNSLNNKLDSLSQMQPMECAKQHSLEAQWVINYTDDWARAAHVLAEFEKALESDLGQPRLEQDVDGSWGSCAEEWYRKLEPTVDVLQEARWIGVVLDHPLKFMDRLKDADVAVAEFDCYRVSNIAETGRNHRDEQGARLTAMSQMALKEKFRVIFGQHPELAFDMDAAYVETYLQYLWKLQNPKTGYWGPTYIFDGVEVCVQDLSNTFHVIRYYYQRAGKGWPDIPNLAKIAETTLAIKDHAYPAGWLENGSFTDHHNYDLAVLFSKCWNAAPPDLQRSIAPELQKLVNWCVQSSLNGDHFGSRPSISSYYYGVRFLDEIGLWQEPFWRVGPVPLPAGVPTAAQIRDNLIRGFTPIRDSSEYSETIAEKLGLT